MDCFGEIIFDAAYVATPSCVKTKIVRYVHEVRRKVLYGAFSHLCERIVPSVTGVK